MRILERYFNNRSEVLEKLKCEKVIIHYSANQKLLNLFKKVEKVNQVQNRYEADFVTLEKSADFNRFFKYWNKVKKTAFLNNGTGRV